jgi:PAS domain S-box-containing protein
MSPSSEAIEISCLVLDALEAGIIVLDSDRRILIWNAWMEHTAGVVQASLVGKRILEALPALADTRFSDATEDAIQAGASSILTHSLHADLLPLHLPDGRRLLHDLIIRPLPAQGGRRCLIKVRDVTATVERERLLRDRRDAKYRAIVDTAQDAIVTTDTAGKLQWMNSAAERIFGRTSEKAVGQDIGNLLSSGDVPWPRNQEALALQEASVQPVELTGRRHDGTLLNLELSLAPWQSEGRLFLTGILRDVTERRRVREALEQAVADKTVLLREINHRVKNSLQLVSGLLNLQMASVSDDSAKSLLKDASDRISAVARVHHRLYQADRFHSLDFAAFLQELCDDLAQASGHSVCDIHLTTDPLEVSVDHAAPLGLIANELITNAIKHRAADPAVISVSLECRPDSFEITVADQGRGLPPDFDAERTRTLGMRIITALTRQIGGAMEIIRASVGATFRITVPSSQHSCGGESDEPAGND